jgi:hypothetical protein
VADLDRWVRKSFFHYLSSILSTFKRSYLGARSAPDCVTWRKARTQTPTKLWTKYSKAQGQGVFWKKGVHTHTHTHTHTHGERERERERERESRAAREVHRWCPNENDSSDTCFVPQRLIFSICIYSAKVDIVWILEMQDEDLIWGVGSTC